MLTGTELKARISRRRTALSQKDERHGKDGHVRPCNKNFDYSSIMQGSKEGLALILDEINGK